jgi:tRNA-dihydrouridine synthase
MLSLQTVLLESIPQSVGYFNLFASLSDKTPEEKLHLLLEHMRLWQDTWGNTKHFPILRKFFKVYANGFPRAQELRMQLMETQNPEETEHIVASFLQSLSYCGGIGETG